MPHMVIYRSADGKPAYHQTEALEDAVRFVEHLRNDEQINDSRLFRMEEVKIEFKTYYRVEVAGGEESAVAAPAAAAPAAAAPAAAAPAAAAPAAAAPAADAAPAQPAVKPLIPAVASGDTAERPTEPAGASNGAGRFGLFNKA